MKTKAELIAYIEKYFEDTDLIYVPSFLTLDAVQTHYEFLCENSGETEEPRKFTNDDLKSIIDIYENINHVWEGMDEGLSEAIEGHLYIEAKKAGNL